VETANTIVSASTASTNEARNAAVIAGPMCAKLSVMRCLRGKSKRHHVYGTRLHFELLKSRKACHGGYHPAGGKSPTETRSGGQKWQIKSAFSNKNEFKVVGIRFGGSEIGIPSS
jgi:hypothetical protein